MRKAVFWTALERELFSTAYKDICAKQPTLGRFEKIAEAQKVLDVSLHRSPYDFSRTKWFLELKNSMPKEQPAPDATADHRAARKMPCRVGRPTTWSDKEKNQFMARFKKLSSAFPDTPLRVLLRNAMEKMPKRKRLDVGGILRTQWFNERRAGLDPQRTEFKKLSAKARKLTDPAEINPAPAVQPPAVEESKKAP